MNRFKKGTKIILVAAMLFGGMACMPVFAADNPMEEVGVEHNLYLECLSLSKDQDASPLRRLVEDCGYAPGMSTDDFVKKYEPLLHIDPTTTLAKRLQSSTIKYSDYERSFFYRIDEVVATTGSLEEAVARFSTLEQEAIARLSDKSEGGRAVLATFSTLRHSLEYWSRVDVEAIGLHGNHGAKRWWKWLIVALVDAFVSGELGPGLGGVASELAGSILNRISD